MTRNGKLKRDIQTKHIKISKTDSRRVAVSIKVKKKNVLLIHIKHFASRNGFVLASVCVAGNVHDSVSFFSAYKVLNDKYMDQIKNVCLDAGYI